MTNAELAKALRDNPRLKLCPGCHAIDPNPCKLVCMVNGLRIRPVESYLKRLEKRDAT